MKTPGKGLLFNQLDAALNNFRTAFKQAFALQEIARRISEPLSPEIAKRITLRTNAFLQSQRDAWAAFEPVRPTLQALSGRKAAFDLVWDFLVSKTVAIQMQCDLMRFGEPAQSSVEPEHVASKWRMLRWHLLMPVPNIDRARYLKLCHRMEDERDKAKTRAGMRRTDGQ